MSFPSRQSFGASVHLCDAWSCQVTAPSEDGMGLPCLKHSPAGKAKALAKTNLVGSSDFCSRAQPDYQTGSGPPPPLRPHPVHRGRLTLPHPSLAGTRFLHLRKPCGRLPGQRTAFHAPRVREAKSEGVQVRKQLPHTHAHTCTHTSHTGMCTHTDTCTQPLELALRGPSPPACVSSGGTQLPSRQGRGHGPTS